MMVLGYVLARLGIIDDKIAAWLNKFVFKIALPVLLFGNLATQDFAGTWDGKFVLFCVVATTLSITFITLLSKVLVKNKARRGEFIQGSYRSSAALLGMAFIHNIYGDASVGMAPLMILGSVPIYNILAVIILIMTTPSPKEDNSLFQRTAKGIVTNPIIIGIFIGLIWSLLKVPIPKFVGTMVDNIGGLATPLGLISMGATFEFKKSLENIKPALAASFIKLMVLVAIFMPLAVKIGFRGEQIIAILVMLGSATTISCFIMAKNMGHEGTLTSSIVMMTTFLCSFSLTFWLFILKTFALI